MAWLETSNRFKDTPKISFKTHLLKKGILSKLFIICTDKNIFKIA
ncbi:hypothetical protein HPCPY6261_0874 [Helicobacter pylori CPY6261]|nr:hypothetical protein HPCPY6261_0874 [Helicobacter pylori CPY6261]